MEMAMELEWVENEEPRGVGQLCDTNQTKASTLHRANESGGPECWVLRGCRSLLLCLHCQQSRKSVRITQNSRLLFSVARWPCVFGPAPCSSIILRHLSWWLWHLKAGKRGEGAPCGTDKVSAPSCSFQQPRHWEKLTAIVDNIAKKYILHLVKKIL